MSDKQSQEQSPIRLSDILLSRRKEIIAIIGLSKNAGKTSVLNYLIKTFPVHKYGLMSTGRDGEDTDTVYATPKPKIQLPEETIFCSDTQNLDRQGTDITVLHKLPWQTAGRQLWIVKSNALLETEIIGPATVQDQISCAKLMQKLGATKIIIDGSIDRKSIVSSAAVDKTILVSGASFGSLNRNIAELQRLRLLSSIPKSPFMPSPMLRQRDSILIYNGKSWQDTKEKSLLNSESSILSILNSKPQALYLPGALTETALKKLHRSLANSATTLIVRHPYHLKLALESMEQLLQSNPVYTLIPFEISAIALNSFAVGANHLDAALLREEIKREFSNMLVFDIMEAYER